ncbi:hypothetical protein AAFF_G00010470 [Aldrovandia affinis]|uniref:Uncharacterized protein n=1 Tax=Aldrovandia affinis TaxID=143900 RepID=A0AAD7S717_9TELE|nr:hypothetical protein AAFF_G00010470 [Aldrovandia affinis]
MEHSFADLLSDAFSDTVLPCYQEGELDFEPLNLEEGDGEGSGNGGFEGLPSLAEVDEDDDPEEEEEADHVTMGTLTEEQNWSKSGLPQQEDWGDILDLGGQEVKDGQKISAEDKDSMEDKDARGFSSQLDSSQMISLRGRCLDGDPMEDAGNTGSGNPPQDQGNELEFCSRGANSEGGDGLECPQAGTDADAVADADVVIGADIVTDAVADIDAVFDTDIVTDIVTVTPSDAVPDADVWIGGFADECCYSVREESQDCFLQVLQAEPFSGELKEFSEADCGVIGEGYAEYPSEEEDMYEDKEEVVEEELGRELGQFSEISKSEVGGCGEQKTVKSEGVGSEGEREGNGIKAKEKEREDVGLYVEEEIEVSDSSSLRSEAGAEKSVLLNEGSVAEPTSTHGKQPQDWTEDHGGNFSERSDDSDDEILSKIKWAGEEWDNEREEDLKLKFRQMPASADKEDPLHSIRKEQVCENEKNVLHMYQQKQGCDNKKNVLHSIRQEQICDDEEVIFYNLKQEQICDDEEDILHSITQEQDFDNEDNVLHIKQQQAYDDEKVMFHNIKQEQGPVYEEEILHSIIQEQAYDDEEFVFHGIRQEQVSADEEYVCDVEVEDGKADEGVGGSGGGCPGEALGGWSPGATSPSDSCSGDSESESSLSDLEPWPHRMAAATTLRALSTEPPCLWPDPDSQEEGATELFSSTQAYRNTGTEEGELGNMEEEEEEEEEERNWEQERERIQAFYRYYNDDKEEDYVRGREDKGRSSRKHMVRFCLDSPPVQRDSDSSDTDVVSSSSEGTEGLDTAVTSTVTRRSVRIEEEGDGESHREKFTLLLKQSEVTQAELKKLNIELRALRQSNRVPSLLVSALKLSLVSVVGVMMFWWATDQLDWTGPVWTN